MFQSKCNIVSNSWKLEQCWTVCKTRGRNYSRSDLFRNSNGEFWTSPFVEKERDENSSLTLDSLSLRTCFPPSGGVLKRLIELWTRTEFDVDGLRYFFSANEENYLTFSLLKKSRLDFWICLLESISNRYEFCVKIVRNKKIRWNRDLITTIIWFELLYHCLKIN